MFICCVVINRCSTCCSSIFRLADRNLSCVKFVRYITALVIKSLKDTCLDTTSSNPHNDFLLTVMYGVSLLERDLISKRTKEGFVSAKAKGRNGGKPSKLKRVILQGLKHGKQGRPRKSDKK
ncbi:MAG: recombinase family protein [Lachnospiraceae bacterium]|nr:recombinase family protein [Lachnospiraceae bacterium]